MTRVNAPTADEIFGPDSTNLDRWRERCEVVDADVIDAQIRRHHSLYLLKWSASDCVVTELAEWGQVVELVAERRRVIAQVAIAYAAEVTAERGRLLEQNAALREQLRAVTRSFQRRAA